MYFCINRINQWLSYMKRIFTLLSICLLVCTAWGQQADTRSIEAHEGQLWWKNYDDSSNDWYLVSTPAVGHYHAAIFIPRNLVGGEGTTIDGFSFYAVSPAMQHVKVWVSKALPAKDGQADLETKEASASVNSFNDVAFDKSYEIPDEGLYVGLSFDITTLEGDNADNALLMTMTEKNREGAFWMIGPNDSKWTSQEGNMLAKVLFGGGRFFQNRVGAYDFGQHYGVLNKTAKIPVTLSNQGANEVSSIDYTVTTEGKVSAEKHATCSVKGFGSDIVKLEFPADDVVGDYAKTLTITKVNGEANTSSDNTAQGTLTTMSYQPTVVPVMEEFTGTWCDWCPRGMVGLKMVNENYGDKVITISVHDDDPMEIAPYDFHKYIIYSYPSAAVNRDYIIDPYRGIFFLDQALEEIVPGEIKVEAEWTDDKKTDINIHTKTIFGMNASSAQFALGFVLVENGLKGSGTSWEQANGYSGRSGYEGIPELYALTLMPNPITDMVYNHVAVDGWGVLNGVDGSVSGSFNAETPLTYSCLVSISSNTLIQDKSQLSVVALLIDRNSGKIINGAQTLIGAPGSTGIQSVEYKKVDAEGVNNNMMYNLNGQRVEMLGKGLYIKDGKKVIVR